MLNVVLMKSEPGFRENRRQKARVWKNVEFVSLELSHTPCLSCTIHNMIKATMPNSA